MENGFDLSGTREKMILSCSPNYRFTEFKFEHFFCVAAAHSPLLYYLSVSLLAVFFLFLLIAIFSRVFDGLEYLCNNLILYWWR